MPELLSCGYCKITLNMLWRVYRDVLESVPDSAGKGVKVVLEQILREKPDCWIYLLSTKQSELYRRRSFEDLSWGGAALICERLECGCGIDWCSEMLSCRWRGHWRHFLASWWTKQILTLTGVWVESSCLFTANIVCVCSTPVLHHSDTQVGGENAALQEKSRRTCRCNMWNVAPTLPQTGRICWRVIEWGASNSNQRGKPPNVD